MATTKKIAPETVLVTGASAGIGESLARCFAADGHRLVLVARSEDKLNELATRLQREHRIKTLVIGRDLSKPTAVDEIYEETTAAGPQVV